MEEPSKGPEATKPSTPVASPARSAHQEETRQELSPGEGSGTKRAEEEAIRTTAGEDAATMTRDLPPRADSPPPAQTSFPLASVNMPALESLNMAGLRNEYLNRLTQHVKLEGELVKMMHRRHEVNMLLLIYNFCIYSSLYTVAPKQQVFYLLKGLVLKKMSLKFVSARNSQVSVDK